MPTIRQEPYPFGQYQFGDYPFGGPIPVYVDGGEDTDATVTDSTTNAV